MLRALLLSCTISVVQACAIFPCVCRMLQLTRHHCCAAYYSTQAPRWHPMLYFAPTTSMKLMRCTDWFTAAHRAVYLRNLLHDSLCTVLHAAVAYSVACGAQHAAFATASPGAFCPHHCRACQGTKLAKCKELVSMWKYRKKQRKKVGYWQHVTC